MAFDPYHRWLAIPKEHRPPTYYQLLTIAPTEDDPEVIEEAAIRQSAHLRTYQVGPHAEDCTRLLNEIAAARATLLNPAKRREYDAKLAAQRTATAEAVTATAPSRPQFNLEDDDGVAVVRRPAPASVDIRRKHPPLFYAAIAGGALSIVLIVVVALLLAWPATRPVEPMPIAKKPEPKPMVKPPDLKPIVKGPDPGPVEPAPKPEPPRAVPANPIPPPLNPADRLPLPPSPQRGPERPADGPAIVGTNLDGVRHVQFLPGQRQAIFLTNDNVGRKHGYYVWDLDAKAARRWFPATRAGNVPSSTFCVDVSADGSWALGGEFHQLRHLNLATGEDRVISWANFYPNEISLAPDGKQALIRGILQGQNHSKVLLCDLDNLSAGRELAADISLGEFGWTDQGKTAFVRMRNEVHLFDRATGKRGESVALNSYPSALTASRDGQRLAMWMPYNLCCFDVPRRRQVFRTPLESIQSSAPLMMSGDGRWLAVAQRNRVTRVDAANGAKDRTWEAARGVVSAGALSTDGRNVLTWSNQDRALRLWDLEQSPPTFASAPAKLGASHRIDNQQYTQVVPWQGNECLMNRGNELTICRLPTLEPVRPVLRANTLPHFLASSGVCPPWVYLHAHDRVARVNVANQVLEPLPVVGKNIQALAVSGAMKYLVLGAGAALKLYDGAGQNLIAERNDLDHVRTITIFQNEKRCLVATNNGLHLLDLPTLASVKAWSQHAACVRLSPDDRLAAVAAFNALYVLDLSTEQFVAVLYHGGASNVPAFAFLGGSSLLAYAEGEAICLYDLRLRKEIAYFPYEAGHIQRLDVAADGRTIITHRDGTHIWELSKELAP